MKVVKVVDFFSGGEEGSKKKISSIQFFQKNHWFFNDK